MEVVAFPRTEQGSGASRRLRRAGQTPGIIYGGTEAPVNIALDHNALYHALKKEAFHSSILDMKVDGKTEKVVLRDFQMHAYKQLVMHADFQRVDPNQKLHVKVPLHFVNAELSPGVKEQNGVPNHVVNELNITCFPDDLPEYIEVDMGAMKIGDAIHVLDLKLPKGVEPVLHRGENPSVATIIQPVLVTEEDTAAEAVPAASEVPTTAQAAPEAAAEGDKAKAGDKGGDKKEKK